MSDPEVSHIVHEHQTLCGLPRPGEPTAPKGPLCEACAEYALGLLNGLLPAMERAQKAEETLARVEALLFRRYTGSPGFDATPEHVREIDAIADLYDDELAAALRTALHPEETP